MANYKLTTATPTSSATSYLAFTASATNTVISSIVASDSATSTLEALIKKNGGSVLEVAHKQVQVDKPEELLTAPLALEAGDELYVRTSRTGANFVISYVEETTVANGTALGGLVDVDTTGASDGQSLVYDGSAGEWVPQTITGGSGGGASALDDLSDVAITGGTSGHILRSNGTNFVNVSPTTDIIPEGSVNEYYTDAKVDARIALIDADDIDDASTTNNRFVTPTQQTSLGFLAPVTTSIDLDQMDADVTTNNSKVGYTDAAVDTRIGAADLQDLNNVTASPTSGEFLKWDGTNWVTAAASGGTGGVVDSVNGISQAAVVLDADDIDDSSTTHKFVAQAELDKLGHITVTQAVDLDATELLASSAFTTANANQSNLSNLTASIQNHTDVSLSQGVPSNLTDGVFLRWDNGTLKWNDHVLEMGSISDVDLTTTAPSTGDVLEWDGTNWVPAAPTVVTDTHMGSTDLTADNNRIYDVDGNEFNIELNTGDFVVSDGQTQHMTVNLLDGVTIGGVKYPTSDGTNGQVLTTDGSGQLSFTTASGGGGGNPLSSHDQTLTGDRVIDTDGNDLEIELDPTGTGDTFKIHDGTHDLFEVNTTTSGTLFSVNDVSGLPTFQSNDDGSAVMPKILTAAPTGTATEGTMQLAIISGTSYLYVYIDGAWRKTTLA